MTRNQTNVFHGSFYVDILKILDQRLKKIEIFDYDDQYRWIKVSEVDSLEDGASFLKNLDKKSILTAEDIKKRDRLFELVTILLKTPIMGTSNITPLLLFQHARQFLFNANHEWILVDPY